MRFEMKTQDVHAIITLVFTTLDTIKTFDVSNLNAVNLMIRKIRSYGSEAFNTREEFRSTIKKMLAKTEEVMVKYAKNTN